MTLRDEAARGSSPRPGYWSRSASLAGMPVSGHAEVEQGSSPSSCNVEGVPDIAWTGTRRIGGAYD